MNSDTNRSDCQGDWNRAVPCFYRVKKEHIHTLLSYKYLRHKTAPLQADADSRIVPDKDGYRTLIGLFHDIVMPYLEQAYHQRGQAAEEDLGLLLTSIKAKIRGESAGFGLTESQSKEFANILAGCIRYEDENGWRILREKKNALNSGASGEALKT